jgi:hypothetical protein
MAIGSAGWRLSGVRGPATSYPSGVIFVSKAAVKVRWRRARRNVLLCVGGSVLQRDLGVFLFFVKVLSVKALL